MQSFAGCPGGSSVDYNVERNVDSGGAIPERVQKGTRILLGSGLEKICFIIWQRSWLCLVYLFPENSEYLNLEIID